MVSAPGANISAGRNAAIAAASGEVIASTDAGVWLDPGWLAALLAPMEKRPDRFVAMVSGWFVADPQTVFETAMGATVLPHLREVSRAHIPAVQPVGGLSPRKPGRHVGGYPEWLDYCEDLVFDIRLRALYPPLLFAPEAVAHFRPRRSLTSFFKQYYHYARGDGKAELWRKRHAIRYLTYLVAAPVLVALAVLHSPWWWLALFAGAAVYTATPYRRLWPMLAPYGLLDRLKAILLVPVIRVVGDVAKMLGYPVGLAWRWRNRHRPEVHWQIEPQVD